MRTTLAALLVASLVLPVAAGAPGGAAEDGRTETVARNTTVNATLARASGDLFCDLTSVESIRDARERGLVVSSRLPVEDDRGQRAFVPGDVLVLRLESDRLDEALRSRDGATPTERFLGFVNGTDARLRIVQTYDTVTPERQVKQVVVSESRVRVLAEGDTRWVLLDTGNATVRYGAGGPDSDAEFREGEAYRVWFEFDTGSNPPEPRDRPRVPVAEGVLEFDLRPGRERFYRSSENVSVGLRSTLAPGDEVTVRAELPNGTVERTAVLAGRNVTRTAVPLGLSGLAEGTSVPLELYRDGVFVTETTVTVDVPSATLEIGPRDPWDRYVTVSSSLSRGGVLALESADGRVRYDSETVDPGTDSEVRLAFPSREVHDRTEFAVVAYRRVDGDGEPGSSDVPYTVNGTVVRREGVFDASTRPTGTPTVTVARTVSVTPTPTDTPTSSASPPPRAESPPPGRSTGAGAPGFGPLAALLAVVGLGLLARRR